METIVRKAYAKINLGLDVIKRRPDGYHEVKMIMQTVGIYDVLTFQERKESGILLEVNHAGIPADKNNLVYKAAQLIREQYEIKQGIKITLEKNIPIAAGMAGGSTDAAAVFQGMKQLFEIPMDTEKMMAMAVKIGADVPYCVMGGTALSEGIGEILSPLPAPPEGYLVIARPDINVSTRFVYESLDAQKLSFHPDIDGMVEALREGSLRGITDRMANVLETVTVREYPVIQEIKNEMLSEGAENALMSGSGPTVFGIWKRKEEAGAAAERLQKKRPGCRVFCTGFVNGKLN